MAKKIKIEIPVPKGAKAVSVQKKTVPVLKPAPVIPASTRPVLAMKSGGKAKGKC